MKIFAFIALNCVVLGFSASTTNNNNVFSVPEDVMSFIMGCDGRFSETEGPKIPVTRTAIDTHSGTETKEVSMMNIAELRQSLLETVEGEEVVSQILAQVEESLAGRQIADEKNTHCTNVKIEVPQQEVTGLSEQLQAVVQQNNYQLLEQVNTLFSFKLNSFYKEFEEMLEKKLAELGAGLIQFQQAQQTANQKPSKPTVSETASSIGETRIFLSNAPVHSFTATNVEHAPVEAPAEDYIVDEQIVESDGFSASNPEELLDYPEENEVPMNPIDEEVNEQVQPSPPQLVTQSTTQSTTQSSTQSTTQPSTRSTTQSTTTTTSTTTTPPPPTTTTPTPTTTTTTPAPQLPATEQQDGNRSSFRRRRPGFVGSPRRPGIGRPFSADDEVAPAVPEEGEERIEEKKDAESQGLRKTRMEEMRRKRKEMLDRLRG